MAGTTICGSRPDTVPKKMTATAAEIAASDSGSRTAAAALRGRPLSTSDWLVEMTPPQSGITSEWLIEIASQSESKPDLRQIRRVPDLLRKNKKHVDVFDPAVVSIGPYHRSERLLAMEYYKKAAAASFAEQEMVKFYEKVIAIVGACRECYHGPLPEMTDEQFALMLLFDGCFVLQFINQFVKNVPKDQMMSAHLHGFILRDMFLLENQLPYLLLEKLMEVKSAPIDEFLDDVAGTQVLQRQKMEEENCSTIGIAGPHPHLLARLRERQLGPTNQMLQISWGSGLRSFRSAKELIERGIKLRRGKTSSLRNVKFERGLVWGELSLPQIVVDDLTRSRLLNMIALEACGTAGGDYGITSFVWLLDLLIDRADDVKELRKAGVLLNALGSDEQVAELFNEIATDLVPDQQAYSTVMNSVGMYYECEGRVSFYRMLHTHFGSPWSAIAFLAAFVLLALTIVQTVFSVIQTHYTIHPVAPSPN